MPINVYGRSSRAGFHHCRRGRKWMRITLRWRIHNSARRRSYTCIGPLCILLSEVPEMDCLYIYTRSVTLPVLIYKTSSIPNLRVWEMLALIQARFAHYVEYAGMIFRQCPKIMPGNVEVDWMLATISIQSTSTSL